MLRIDVHQSGTALIEIQLSGRLGDTDVGQLGEVIKSTPNTRRNVIVELSGLTGIDRSGVAMLVEMAGCGVRLAHCPAFLTLWLRAECRSRMCGVARIRDISTLRAAESGPGFSGIAGA
jgi:ABC-type transporter Mla MlaB component